MASGFYICHNLFIIIVVDVYLNSNLMFFFAVPQSYVPGADTSRQRHHAPLYGRLVSEEHLPAAHRDVHLQVSVIYGMPINSMP